jgi:hypothetical protein
MPEPLTFVSHDMVHFGDYYTWVDLKYFAIQPEASDVSLLTSLITHAQYHDHYAGQDPTSRPTIPCMDPTDWTQSPPGIPSRLGRCGS